jgi:hypothetical protein
MMEDTQKEVDESVDQEEAPSIDEQIMAAMDAQTTDSTDDVEEVEEATDEVVEETAEAETEELEVESTEDEEEAEEELKAHEHWKPEYKEAFSGMDKTQKQAWIDRETEVENGFRTKAAELNQVRSSFEAVRQAVEPYAQSWQMKGITPSAGVNRALAMTGKLDENPEQAIVELAQHFGVNLEKAVQDAPYEDPQMVALRRQVEELNQQQTNAQQNQSQQKEEYLQRQLTDFRDERDTSGNPKHPHFERLFVQSATYLKAGQANSLSEAYEMAVQYDPQAQKEVQGQQKVTKISAKKEAAKKAKGATKSVSSSDTGKTNPSQTLDESILEQLEASGNYD